MMKRDNKNISDNLHKGTIKFRKLEFFFSLLLLKLIVSFYELMVNIQRRRLLKGKSIADDICRHK